MSISGAGVYYSSITFSGTPEYGPNAGDYLSNTVTNVFGSTGAGTLTVDIPSGHVWNGIMMTTSFSVTITVKDVCGNSQTRVISKVLQPIASTNFVPSCAGSATVNTSGSCNGESTTVSQYAYPSGGSSLAEGSGIGTVNITNVSTGGGIVWAAQCVNLGMPVYIAAASSYTCS